MKQLSTNECILQYCTVCITNKIQLSSNEEKQLFVDDLYTIHTIHYTVQPSTHEMYTIPYT